MIILLNLIQINTKKINLLPPKYMDPNIKINVNIATNISKSFSSPPCNKILNN